MAPQLDFSAGDHSLHPHGVPEAVTGGLGSEEGKAAPQNHTTAPWVPRGCRSAGARTPQGQRMPVLSGLTALPCCQ